MVDPVGVVLGVAGLAGLFSTCVQCFELVNLGRAYARDFEILQTKFEAQKVRFLIWGQAVGVTEGSSYDTRLDLPEIRPTVIRLLNCVRLLFSDSQELNRRYGLFPDPGGSPTNNRIIFRETYRRFHARISKAQSDASFLTTARWAIGDKTKFVSLVQDVKDLVDALEDITKSLQMLARQQEIITVEIESITDTTSLRLLEEACSGSEDGISDAASLRLRRIRGQSQGGARPPTLDTQLRSLSLEVSFHTTASRLTDSETEHPLIAPTTALTVKDLPQNQRVLDQYRLQSPSLRSDVISRASVPATIDSGVVGLALRDMKEADIEHTEAVIRHFSQTSNPEEKRMVIILRNLLDSAVTTFVSLAPIGENLFDLLGRIEGPPASPYQGGVFHVRLEIPGDFPWAPPKCRFLTKIYHPNIDAQGRICLDVLEPQNWRMELMYLEGILLSISSLLDEPAIDDPLVPEIAAQFLKDRTVYDEIATMYTRRYAHGDPPVLSTNATRATGSSWQSRFLRERLSEIQHRTTVLIQALQVKPRTMFRSTERLAKSYDGERATAFLKDTLGHYIGFLFQLTSELAVLSQTLDDPNTLHAIAVTKFDELERFFDSCAGEFRALAIDERWRKAFPSLPFFRNDTTRGTGQAHTYKFLDRESDLRREDWIFLDQEIDPTASSTQILLLLQDKTQRFVTPWLGRLEGLVRIARLLNGNLTLSPS
jgi:ubiquitin-protein ligase